MNMKMSFRWYGEDDPVSLQYISQIPGMRSIVSAVYDVAPGEIWPEESLIRIKNTYKKETIDNVKRVPFLNRLLFIKFHGLNFIFFSLLFCFL